MFSVDTTLPAAASSPIDLIQGPVVSASRRRKIVSVCVQVMLTLVAVAVITALDSPTSAIWIVAWLLIDFLSGGNSAVADASWTGRIPLISGLVVSGTIAFLAAFNILTGLGSGESLLDRTGENDHLLLLSVLWALALTTVLVRSLIRLALPKRALHVVASTCRKLELGPANIGRERSRGSRPVGQLACGESLRGDTIAFVSAVLAEAKRCDVELVELMFSPDAEVVRLLSWELRDRDIELYVPLFALGVDPKRIRAQSMTHSSGLLIAPSRPGLRVRVAKRFFDVVVASCLLVVLAPVLVAVAVAIKVTMPGPVLYRQERIGQERRQFRICKFRSMVVGADAQLSSLLRAQGTDDKPLFKVVDDPRITRLGTILRRTSLDELPQLFNVIGGTMSLVGPRPQRDGEVALYSGSDFHRLGVRPGMTGLWQVSGRSDLAWSEAREFDLYYAHNWNLLFDLHILMRTFGAVVRAAGAR